MQFWVGSLSLLALIAGVANLIPVVGGSIILYMRDYRDIRPSVQFYDRKLVNSLISLGWRFFILQISAVIIFTTDSLIISQLFSPSEVTPYALSNKYMGVVMMFFGIILQPYWASFTHAYELGEETWIRNTVRKLLVLWIIVVLLIVVMVIISPLAYNVWLGESVSIPFSLTLLMAVHMAILSFAQIYSKYLNGVGKLKVQYILATVAAVVNIPLSVFLAKTCGLGVHGVMLGTVLSNIPTAIASPYQYNLLSRSKAVGIWNE
jgi:O-antigen/teichoic acid export membrane protein